MMSRTLKLLSFALLLLPRPSLAVAVRIDKIGVGTSTWMPDPALGSPPLTLSGATTLTAADCVAIATAQDATIQVTWSWLNPVPNPAIGQQQYGIKVQAPPQLCDQHNLEEEDIGPGCLILVNDQTFVNQMTFAGETFALDMKKVLGEFTPDPTGANCAAIAGTSAHVYFILPAPPNQGTGEVLAAADWRFDFAPASTADAADTSGLSADAGAAGGVATASTAVRDAGCSAVPRASAAWPALLVLALLSRRARTTVEKPRSASAASLRQ